MSLVTYRVGIRARTALWFFAFAGAQLAPAAFAATTFPLKSVNVELPSSDRLFPKAAGVETVTANCLTCHSAGMILNQPPLKKAAWEAEVKKMISVYKAPVADSDVATIVNYLDQIKGAQ
jgi:cytochrome c5